MNIQAINIQNKQNKNNKAQSFGIRWNFEKSFVEKAFLMDRRSILDSFTKMTEKFALDPREFKIRDGEIVTEDGLGRATAPFEYGPRSIYNAVKHLVDSRKNVLSLMDSIERAKGTVPIELQEGDLLHSFGQHAPKAELAIRAITKELAANPDDSISVKILPQPKGSGLDFVIQLAKKIDDAKYPVLHSEIEYPHNIEGTVMPWDEQTVRELVNERLNSMSSHEGRLEQRQATQRAREAFAKQLEKLNSF